jgi:peptidoglycan/LPS O-acetylase OafA/YrhL
MDNLESSKSENVIDMENCTATNETTHVLHSYRSELDVDKNETAPEVTRHNILSYRSELDGLRAIAVLAVIFYHAGFEFCIGGFVGVDVFFVLSGYLMTSIILREIEKRKFTIMKFYERRIRRILPMLYTTIIVCYYPAYGGKKSLWKKSF